MGYQLSDRLKPPGTAEAGDTLWLDENTMLIGRGSRGARAKIANRQNSVKNEKLAKGIQQLRENESRFRAAKNSNLSDASQGAELSVDDPYDVWEMQKKVREDWGSEAVSYTHLTLPTKA